MKVVFLHIPKTAGSSVTKGLQATFGARRTSPIRAHSQTKGSCFEGWEKYDVFAGHLNWADLYEQPGPKFVFSVLRDPKERIASFYFFLRQKAEKLSPAELERPENAGKRAILSLDIDDYFLGRDARWRSFVRDHYDNFYCSYFAQRRFRSGGEFHKLSDEERLEQARRGLRSLDFVCTTQGLGQLEDRIIAATGTRVSIARRHDNPGPLPQSRSRWKALTERLGSDKTILRLEAYTRLDSEIFEDVAGRT